MHIISPLIQSTKPMSLIHMKVLNALRSCVGLKRLTVVCEMARVQVPFLAAREGKDTFARFFTSIFCPSFTKVEKATSLKWGGSLH